MTNFNPTDEQKNILTAFNKGKDIKIHAFAGTGKTTTLAYLAKNTKRRGLYIAFNKRVAKEAVKRMPNNTEASTIHSIAWKWASEIFPKEKLLHSPHRTILKEMIAIPSVNGFSEFKTIGTLSLILKSFCNSNAKTIGKRHLPWKHPLYSRDQEVLTQASGVLISAAQKAWRMMRNPAKKLPLGHDGYLKLWSLNQPSLDYDFLFIDEAQDLSPVMLDVIEGFKKQKVLVGDSQQQIYSWRGAVDAMHHDFDAEDFYLTQTFRFGNELSNLANRILKSLQVERQIKSKTKSGTTVETGTQQAVDTYIFRKNATLISKAVDLYQRELPFFIVDPNKNIEQSVEDYFRLNDGQWGKSQAFEGFKSWEKVIALSQKEELTPFRGFVELFESVDPNLIRKAVKSTKNKEGKSYPTLTSAHQSKGLEWDIVSISHDFVFSNDDLNRDQIEEELRLLYVALTRAKNTLDAPAELIDFCQRVLGHSIQKFAVIDLETTGLDPQHGDRITEIGFVIWQNGKIVDKYESLINPERDIPEFVQDLTGITNKMVMNARSSAEVLSEAMSIIGDIPLIAHNASFERKFLNAELRKISPKYEVNLICSLLLSRRVFPDANGYKLGDLVTTLNLPKGNAHRALSDALMTAHLVSTMNDKLLTETDGQFLLSADNLLRISKIAPKQFRDKGVRKAYLLAQKKQSHVKYSTFDFSGEKFNIAKKPIKLVEHHNKRLHVQPQKTRIESKVTTHPPVQSTKKEVKPLPSSKKGGIIGFLRKIIKLANGLFFGPFLLVGTYIMLTEPDKFISFILLIILFFIAYFIHTMAEKFLS